MRVGTLYAVLRLETAQFDAALGHAQSKMGAFMGVLRAAAVLGAQAFAAVVGASLFAAQDFEKHMNESLAIMGDVSDEMRRKMEDAARAVAKTSTFSANQAADAYYYLASAGFTAEQSIAALPAVTAFAQAGVMDLEKATSYLLDTTTTMGLRTDDAAQNMENMARVSDVLTAAAIESNASLEEMAVALMNKAGPALRVLGKDVEEGAAVLMVMANAGVKGKVAGTNLAIVLRELQTKAIKNAEAFEAAGVAVFDASGEMRSMGDIVADLERHLEGLTDEQKKQALLDMGFTDRSVGVVQSLLGTSDAIKKYEAQLREAGGTTQTVAEKQLDTFNNQLRLTWHRIVDVGISIGQKLLPGAKDIVKWFGNWVDANHDLIVSLVIGVVDAIGLAIRFVGDMIDIVADAIEWVKSWGGHVEEFGDLIRSIFSPNGEGIDGLRKYMEQFDLLDDRLVDMTETVLSKFRPAFQDAHDAVMPVAEAVGSVLSNLTQFRDLLVSTFSPDGDALNGVRQYMDAFEDLDPVVVEVMENIGTKVGDTFTYLAEEVFPPLQEAIGVLIEDYIKYLGAQWLWITDEILPKLSELITVIAEESLPMLGDGLNWISDTVVPALDAAFLFFIEQVLPVLQAAMSGILTWFSDNWPLISEIAGRVFGAVAAILEVLGNAIAIFVGVAWTLLEPIATALLPAIGGAASFLLEVLNGVFWAIGVLWNQFAKAAVLIAKGVRGAFEGLIDFFEYLWRTITGEFKNAVNIFVDIINGFIGILNNLRVVIPRVTLPGTNFGIGGGVIDPFNIGYIPRLWKGTSGFPGGMAMVGEQGPELAYLPQGAGVMSNRDLMAALAGGGGETHYHRHFSPVVTVEGAMEDVEDRDDLVEVLQDLSRLEE